MIAKTIKGRGFRGVLEYNLRPEKGYLLDSNMASDNARGLAREFGEIRRLRESLNRSVCHVSIALAPGESLSDNQWRDVASAYLEHMGFANNQYVAVRHTDKDHQHIHLVINRIGLDGSVTSDSNDYRRQEQIMRRLEQRYELQRATPSREAERKAPSRGELEHALRTGEASVRMRLQELVSKTVQHVKTLSTFTRALASQGVDVRLNQAKTGRISGISFALDGVCMKGGDLGKAFTWNSLQRQGLYHEHDGTSKKYEPGNERGSGNIPSGLGDAQGQTGYGSPTIRNLGNEERRNIEKPTGLADGGQERGGGRERIRQRSQGISR